MDGTKEVISEEPTPSKTMPLVKWNPSFAIGVSRAVYSGITQVGTGVRKSFFKEEPPVETSSSQPQVTSDTDILKEVLYEFVENWEGEEPPSPLIFDPDGDFIFLPRPTEEVSIDESWATSSAAPPPYVYIHSGLLTSLQAVTTYPQNIQKYLKEHLHFPSSKNSLDKGDVSSSDISSNAADSVGGDTSSTHAGSGQKVSKDQDGQEKLAIKKQEEEVIKSGKPLLADVLADSVESQVPKPQSSPRRTILTSIGSPLAFRRRLNQPDRDAERDREAPLTEAKRIEGHAFNQTESLSTFDSVEKEIVISIPEGTSVLQIPIEPSEGQVLIPKPVQKHLSWNPIRSHFSFRLHSEGGSDHETSLTKECEIDDEKAKQHVQSDQGGEVISVSEGTQVVQNPVTISEGEKAVVPSLSQKYFNWIPIKSPFSFRKNTLSDSGTGTDTGQKTSSSEIDHKGEIPTQAGQAEVVSDSLKIAETQNTQISVTVSEGAVKVPSSAPRYLSWIPVKSPFRPGRPLSSDDSTKLSRETPTVEVDGKEKALGNSEETQLSQIPRDHFEGGDRVPPSSARPLGSIQTQPSLKFSRPPTSLTEIREEEPTGETDVKGEQAENSAETQVVQIPLDLSGGQILVPQSEQTRLRWVPARLPFAFRSHLGSETHTKRQGVDSCETSEKEVPIQSEERTTPACQEDSNVTDKTLEETSSSLGYWRQVPVKWLNPDTYRLLVANTIIRRKEDLEILCENAHLLESAILEPENVDVDFDELNKIFSTLKALKSIKSSKAGTWSFSPIIPTLYRRYWRIPSEGTSEEQGQTFRRSSFSVSCSPQEPLEPVSSLEGSNNSENINFSGIHELFKQFIISKDSLGVASSVDMASPKNVEKTSGRGFFQSFRNMVWTRENGHLDERNENAPATPSGSEERVDIAPSEKSQERVSQLYQSNQDKNRLTKEWTNAREDLEDFVTTETRSLSGGLDFKPPDEQSKQRDTFSSYFSSPFLSKKCHICEESLSSVGLLMRKRQDYQCKQCKHLFCKKCLISNLQGGECMACRQDTTKQKEEVSSLGVFQSYTDTFKHFRDEFNKFGWDIERYQEQLRFHPTIGSVLRQCRRLEHGYKKCLDDKIDPNKMPGGSLLKKRGIPDWQKPPTWIEAGTKEVRGCQFCSKEWFVDYLHNCRLCGRRVCSQDSSRDFMLYIPDQNTIEYSPKMNVHWKIIRVVGCPSVEPVVHLYMRICFTCKSMLVAHQEKLFTLSYVTVTPDYRKCELTILDIHQETQKMKANIQQQLPQFVKMVDTFSADSKNISETLMKSLVKHEDDLMDQFPRYIIAVDKLREMFPQTEQQIKLVRSLMLEKRSFYRDNVIVYRVAGRQLSEIMPKEEIDHRMITVNTDAINCACIVISQLAFEVLKICLQYKIPEKLAMDIREVSEICEGDLKKMIEQRGKTDKDETWDNHKRKLDEFIKAEMKSERRYLKVDASRQTPNDLKIFLKEESYRRIRSTLIQLKAKSASRAFTGTKEALEKLQKTTQNENLMI